MNRSILTVSPLLLFIGFIVYAIFAEVVSWSIARYLGWDMNYSAYPTLNYGLVTLGFFTYPYLVGRALSSRAGSPNAHWKILRVFVLLLIISVLDVWISEVYGVLWYVVVPIAIVNISCTLVVFAFPARELKSRQLKRRARIPECWSEIGQFFLWPLCVWWLQPTLTYIVIEDDVLKK